MKKERKSNLELLRIVAILLVILSHFNVFGNYPAYESGTAINYILKSIFITGAIANAIFVIITGYFMVESNVKYKKIIKLSLELCFYTYLIAIIAYLINPQLITKSEIIKILFPNIWGNWFLVYYILLYLFIPYLNKLIHSLDKKELKNIIILMFVLFSVVQILTLKALGYSNHAMFILYYFIGSYIRLYPCELFKNNKKIFIFMMCNICLAILSILVIIKLGLMLNNPAIIESCIYFVRNNNSPFVIGIAVSIFLLFNNFNIRNNKTINSIASSVLGIYLIHENVYVRTVIWQQILPNVNYYYKSPMVFIMFAIFKVLAVFILCLIIDKIRIILFDKLETRTSEVIYQKIFHESESKK